MRTVFIGWSAVIGLGLLYMFVIAFSGR